MILVLIFRVNNVTKQIGILRWLLKRELDKTADISQHHLWFPRKRTSEERLRKFHTDDFLMMCHYPDLGSAFDWPKQITLAARPYPEVLGSDRHVTSIEFAFVSQTSFRGEWRREISAVVSGYLNEEGKKTTFFRIIYGHSWCKVWKR